MEDSDFPPSPGLAVAGIMLLIALAPWPYAYYTLLRWVVLIAAGYAAWWSYTHKKFVWPWPLAVMAALFNPIVPFHMTRSDWQLFNVLGSIVAFVAAFSLARTSERRVER